MLYGKIVAVVLTALLLGTAAGWAQNFGAPLDRFFRLEWEAGLARGGQGVVSGYLYNDHGLWADNVRLLVEVLDSSGRMVASPVGYIHGWVPPKGRAYFEVRVPGPASGGHYRVTVHLWDWRSPGR